MIDFLRTGITQDEEDKPVFNHVVTHLKVDNEVVHMYIIYSSVGKLADKMPLRYWNVPLWFCVPEHNCKLVGKGLKDRQKIVENVSEKVCCSWKS